MDSLKADVLKYLASNHSDLFDAWTAGRPFPEVTIQDHCDMVYSLYLIGELHGASTAAVDGFCRLAQVTELPGWRQTNGSDCLSVHNCAYLLGAANLLEGNAPGILADILADRKFKLEQLVDLDTLVPRFPRRWAHHNWRVSHWLGGVPSIILSAERSVLNREADGLSARVRDAVEGLMDSQTGLIRAYKSNFLQHIFRAAYRCRHDPDLGDIGGVAHILWVDHVMGRRYMALPKIYSAAAALFNRHKPFMENVPYCLDFDVVQAVRTSCSQLGKVNPEDVGRADRMMRDIESFFRNPSERFSLHKVPGAVATYHECALLIGVDAFPGVEMRPIDIIKSANWL